MSDPVLDLIGTPDFHRGVALGLEIASQFARGLSTPDAVVRHTEQLDRLALRERLRVEQSADTLDELIGDDVEAATR